MKPLRRLMTTMVLLAGLSGCVDAIYEVDLTSITTGTTVLTQVMDRSIYDMIRANDGVERPASLNRDFCVDGKLALDDEKATCVIARQGAFASLTADAAPGKEPVHFAPAGPGLVRVSFPTAEMGAQLGAKSKTSDPDKKKMMDQMFDGHTLTLRVGGGEVVATNMGLALDKASATTIIPIPDLLNGTVDLPPELFAIIRK